MYQVLLWRLYDGEDVGRLWDFALSQSFLARRMRRVFIRFSCIVVRWLETNAILLKALTNCSAKTFVIKAFLFPRSTEEIHDSPLN